MEASKEKGATKWSIRRGQGEGSNQNTQPKKKEPTTDYQTIIREEYQCTQGWPSHPGVKLLTKNQRLNKSLGIKVLVFKFLRCLRTS